MADFVDSIEYEIMKVYYAVRNALLPPDPETFNSGHAVRFMGDDVLGSFYNGRALTFYKWQKTIYSVDSLVDYTIECASVGQAKLVLSNYEVHNKYRKKLLPHSLAYDEHILETYGDDMDAAAYSKPAETVENQKKAIADSVMCARYGKIVIVGDTDAVIQKWLSYLPIVGELFQ